LVVRDARKRDDASNCFAASERLYLVLAPSTWAAKQAATQVAVQGGTSFAQAARPANGGQGRRASS
jgi:hypothetical protein